MSFAAQAFPAPHHPAPHRQERTGQRAALFRLWRDLAAPEAAAPIVAPPPSAPRAMVSGTVSARFATLMPAMVQLGPAVLGEVIPASAPPLPDRALAEARQRRLKEALQDDMFIF